MSVSASAENLSTDPQSCDGGSMCLELALEGERLCKAGDCRAGVAFFQAAIQAGTDDLRTLSAIYSQLGNAYFYLGDYNKAMHFHKLDLTLARTMNDKLGEAKASGNLGNTLKVMGKFNEAVQCCKRHLEISRSLGDRLSEGRALYNLGNVFHAQGKQMGRVGQNDPGHFPQDVRESLMQAVAYYEENLELMRSLGDRQAMGRACGNLGNTCYLLGDFTRAIKYHTERLRIAQEVGDRPAERRANSNLGNSHIFLGQFENAAEHYKRTLALAEELGDSAVEAQACYSLGNTYTLLREYRIAEEYHARHLSAARKLQDRVGEGRACWSLGNAHAALGNHEKALYYAKEHYNISKELGDVLGMATAQMNIGDLCKVLGLPVDNALSPPQENVQAPRTPFNALRVRRQSMEQLSLIQITPDGKKKDEDRERIVRTESEEENPAETFMELLVRCQSNRMDEQRASLDKENIRAKKLQRSNSSGNKNILMMNPLRSTQRELPGIPLSLRSLSTTSSSMPSAGPSCVISDPPPVPSTLNMQSPPEGTQDMLHLISSLQGERINDQRAELRPVNSQGTLPGRSMPTSRPKPEEDFIEVLARVQGTRLEDQRTPLPAPTPKPDAEEADEEDFFARLMRAQAGRMEDQRATIPPKNQPSNSKN